MIAYLDCSTGVSGDKLLGALVDAGSASGRFTAEHVAALAARLIPEASVTLERVSSRGITGMGVRVDAGAQPPHRSWCRIRELIADAALPDTVKTRATEVFRRVAEAEATVHGCAIDDVHFHEIGAADSIVDVVAACAGIDALGITALTSSVVATGWGTVMTSHGLLPAPTPATSLLLESVPTESGPARGDGTAPGELTTPTGAALVSTLASSFGAPPSMRPVVTGRGVGTRDIGNPNICTLTVGEPNSAATEVVVLLESNIDHLSPEALGFAAEELMKRGALDVWQTPVFMKKQRAAVLLSVLAEQHSAESLTVAIHDLTGSLGVRSSLLTRSVAERESLTVDTPYGPVRAKRGAGMLRPEHDDVAHIARATNRPYDEVRRELESIARESRTTARSDTGS